MKSMLVLLLSLTFGLSPAWAAPAAAGGKGEEALADKYSYASLPKPTEPAAIQSEDSADKKVMQDRKEERDFKYNALIALSCTMALLYLVAATMLFKLPAQQKGAQIVHLTSLALIVYGSLTLALIPTTNEGLTAPIGILGALAGYLFGHSGAVKSARPENSDSA